MSAPIPGTPDAIMAEISQTRAEIAGTLSALEERLSPAAIWSELSSSLTPVRQVSNDFTRSLGASVRDNPLPTALIGLGVCWLAVAGRQENTSPTRAWTDRSKGAAEANRRLDTRRFDQMGDLEEMGEYAETKDTFRETGERISEGARRAARETGERISEGARRAARETRERTDHLAAIARERSSEAYHRTSEAGARVTALARNAASDGTEFARTHPIGVALGVLGVGAIVAAVMIARSERRREDIERTARAAKEYLGETVDRTAGAAREGVARARRAAQDVAGRVKQAAGAPDDDATDAVEVDEEVRRASQGLHEERASFADGPLASDRREQPSPSVG